MRLIKIILKFIFIILFILIILWAIFIIIHSVASGFTASNHTIIKDYSIDGKVMKIKIGEYKKKYTVSDLKGFNPSEKIRNYKIVKNEEKECYYISFYLSFGIIGKERNEFEIELDDWCKKIYVLYDNGFILNMEKNNDEWNLIEMKTEREVVIK